MSAFELKSISSRLGASLSAIAARCERFLELRDIGHEAGRRRFVAALLSFALFSVIALLFLSDTPTGASALALMLALAGWAATLWLQLGARGTSAASASSNDAVAAAALDDAAVLRFAPNGDVADASGAARRLLNLQPALLLGSGLFERVHVADRVAYMCALADLRAGVTPPRLDLRLRKPKLAGDDGPDVFQPFTMTFCETPAGGDRFALLRDDAETTALRDALRDASDRHESADLAKGRFLATVSHELRTPLNAIIGFSEALQHEIFGCFTDPRQREYTGLIKEAADHLLGVVNAILDVSKIESGAYAIQTETFAFAEAAEMCRAMMKLQAERKGIDLRTEIGRGVAGLVADRRAVQQILINLVANAIKFTPERGLVTLGAQRVGSRLHFWVSDTGIGIAEDDLERIGRPFMQVRNDYTREFEGTGLGLSLVKGLVALHGGTMTIESAPGEGTKVAISLPLDGPVEAGRTEAAAPAGAQEEVGYGTFRKIA